MSSYNPPRPTGQAPSNVSSNAAANIIFMQAADHQQFIDMLLQERRQWVDRVATGAEPAGGITPRDVSDRLKKVYEAKMADNDDLSDELQPSVTAQAAQLLCQSLNTMIIVLLTRAKENAVQRRSATIDTRDLLLTINSHPLMRRIWGKVALSAFQPIQPAVPPKLPCTQAGDSNAFRDAVHDAYAEELSCLNDVYSYSDGYMR